MPLKTNRIKFKVAVCSRYLGYDRSNEGPLVFLQNRCKYVGPIFKTIIITLTGTAPTPGLHLFVTKPHFSPNRNIGPNYCTMLMLAIIHRHDDHSRLSSSGNLFFYVWHNLPFKKEGLLCCFLEWKRL